MSAIDDLKNVKVPLWAKCLGWYRARQRRKAARKEVRYIATVFVWQRWTDKDYCSKVWYICKEKAGVRYYEYGSDSYLLDNREKRYTMYASVIEPWILNRFTNQQIIDFAKTTVKEPTRTE
jgi:hypothetical protein